MACWPVETNADNQVDVDFKPAEVTRHDDESAWLVEDDKDVIVKISAPYLAYGVFD